MKKILMLLERFQAGNAVSDYCNQLASMLSKNDFEVHMVFFSGSDFTEREGNLWKHGISFVLHGNNLFNWAMLMNNELKRKAREIFEEHGFDVINMNDWITAPAGMVMRKLSGKPLIFTMHSTEHERGHFDPQSSIISDVEWWACYESRMILTPNASTVHSLKNHLGVPLEKIALVNRNRLDDVLKVFGATAIEA